MFRLEDPLDAPEPRAVARRTDPETSHAAAASVSGIRESQRAVHAALVARGPSTDEDLLDYLRECGETWTPSGARTRRAELANLGLVEDSGDRRRLRTGRMSIVWRATGENR